MGSERALMTERQREILQGDADVSDNYRYKVESQIRDRIENKLRDDVEVLKNSQPEMMAALREIVCE
jgi:hypothetical protein